MLTPQRIKELVGEPNMSDVEAEAVRDYLRSQAELAFEQWQHERSELKRIKDKDKNEKI